MLKIYDGRDYFFQWDLNQRMIVDDPNIFEVNFCNGTMDCTLACEVFVENGLRLVNVPNILLQTPVQINVFAMIKNADQSYTSRSQRFHVQRRTKPEDYAYTETECTRKSLEERVEIIEKNYVKESELDAAIREALRIAQQSGWFTGGGGSGGSGGGAVEIPSLSGEWIINKIAQGSPETVGLASQEIRFKTTLSIYKDDEGKLTLSGTEEQLVSHHEATCSKIVIDGSQTGAASVKYTVESTDATMQAVLDAYGSNEITVYFGMAIMLGGMWFQEKANVVDFGAAQEVSASFRSAFEVVATKRADADDVTKITITEKASGAVDMVFTLGNGSTETIAIAAEAASVTMDGKTIPIAWTEETA